MEISRNIADATGCQIPRTNSFAEFKNKFLCFCILFGSAIFHSCQMPYIVADRIKNYIDRREKMSFRRATTQSNLESFLDRTTPIVPAKFLLKTSLRDLNRLWHPWDRETIEYFTLADLWDRYDEWSAYGAGVPIVLNNDEAVVQYYVPYLSAIQLYTSKSLAMLREDSESGETETRDSFSDSCSDESDCEKMWRLGCGWDASSEEGGFEQDNLWHLRERLGYLYFQYFERSAPYGRVPLLDKINEIARGFPGLMSLKSVDLSPASWMAVAWYPIYHIPTGRSVKDLSACFLTYHTLSSSFQENGPEEEAASARENPEKYPIQSGGIALPAFGLATYKMQGGVWFSGENRDQGDQGDQERSISLLSAADSWLKQLRVQHHDFNYFTGIRHP